MGFRLTMEKHVWTCPWGYFKKGLTEEGGLILPLFHRGDVSTGSKVLASPLFWDFNCNLGFTFLASHNGTSWPVARESELTLYCLTSLALRVSGSRGGGVGLPKSCDPIWFHHGSKMPDTKWQYLMFYLLGISLALVQYFLVMLPFPPLGMGMFILCYNVLEACSFLFYKNSNSSLSWISEET